MIVFQITRCVQQQFFTSKQNVHKAPNDLSEESSLVQTFSATHCLLLSTFLQISIKIKHIYVCMQKLS